jgi:hypothetical protein
MRQSQLFRTTNKSKRLLILLVVMLIFKSSIASDSIYVRFLKTSIERNEYGEYSMIQLRHNLYLFTNSSDQKKILCFCFRKNRLIFSGHLLLLNNDSIVRYAVRDGYWLYFDKRSKYKRVYYVEDAVLRENIDVPIEPQ